MISIILNSTVTLLWHLCDTSVTQKNQNKTLVRSINNISYRDDVKIFHCINHEDLCFQISGFQPIYKNIPYKAGSANR